MDIESLKNIIRAGITKEEFLDSCANKDKDKNESVSIYESSSIASAAIFDELDINKDNKIDENEFNNLKNINKTDGENGTNTLSEDDIKGLYNNISKKIEEYSTEAPEKAYKKAMEEGMDSNTFLSSITFQISTLEGLIKLRQDSSDRIIKQIQGRIDDLILKNNNTNQKLKEEYLDSREKIEKLEKKSQTFGTQAQNDSESIENLTQNIICLESEIKALGGDENSQTEIKNKNKELKKLNKTLNKFNSSYKSAVNSQAEVNSEIRSINLDKILNEIKSNDSTLKTKIEILEQNIEAEKNSAKQDIENYQNQINNLTAIQEYTVQQIQAEPAVSEYFDSDMETFSYDSKALKEKWQHKAPGLSDGFYNKATEVAKRVGCDANVLMGLMMSESGLKAGAVNKSSGATGLIQFMPATARALGTSTSALKQMSAEQQLNYVEKYLQNSKKAAGFKSGDKLDAGSMYTLVFLPAFAKRNILATKGDKYYRANAGLDVNKDGSITKSDLAQRVYKYMK